ncbi:hypothetical protein HPB49_001149 [Dermacentor silvarum]|uniref:Uncharacterized protein n=1 Tax=Dermacentor silvarum TaxID=543639 RepID=A0ACB8D202_DERSI|nr:hypothetical protein HPB49_001149 [Dermacentor silvarum]
MRARNINVVPDHSRAYDVIPSHAHLHVRPSREHAAHGSFSSPLRGHYDDDDSKSPNPVHVTTLPDLSASLPTFNASGTPTFEHWIEELERIQRLARWEDRTLLTIAQGKWKQKVTALTQKAGESLQQYTFAKLKIMSRCPVSITGKERIEYLVQHIRDHQVATSIDVERPRTIDDFLSIVSEVDRALDHARLI